MTSIYLDSCPLIDLAKYKARFHGSIITISQERETDVWQVEKLLDIARAGSIRVITSTLTISECTHIDNNEHVPHVETKRFYSELLTSGKGGIFLVQPILSILTRARNLRWEENIFCKPLDSVHIASALYHKCSEIWTRDDKMIRFANQLEALGLKCIVPSSSQYVTAFRYRDIDGHVTKVVE